MLILTRKPGDSIKIGDDIKITVKEILKSVKKVVLTVSYPEARTITLGRNQSAMITDDIRTVVVKLIKNQIKLGIEAPAEVRIERS